MSKNRLLVAMILAMATVTPAAHAKDKDTDAQPDPNKKVCKSEKVTGSLTRVNRVCMTQAEWAEMAEKTNKSINDLNRNQARFAPGQVGQGVNTPGLGY
ncbi:MAG: hypothetical protein J7485_02560 [Sphingobium sp.]|nr:hypothetical protein [Sphingobium sp.]